MAENENEQPKNSGEVDLYFQPVEDSDSDELKNLAENPRALTEDFKAESMADVAAASEGQDQFDTSNNSSYDEGDIQVLEGLEAVRKRPGMYIGDTTLRGLHHLIYEIVANSVDEALAGRCDTIDVVLNKDGSVTVTDDGSGIPVGNHPKLGIPTVEVVHTVLHAGGKFGGGAYTVSGGLHGVGASVVNALASHMKVQVKREGSIYEIEFEKGKTTVPLHIVGTCDLDDTGTITNFIPDNEIFPDIRFDFDSMITRYREMAFLNKEVTIDLTDDRGEEPIHKHLHYYILLHQVFQVFLMQIRNLLSLLLITFEPTYLILHLLLQLLLLDYNYNFQNLRCTIYLLILLDIFLYYNKKLFLILNICSKLITELNKLF